MWVGAGDYHEGSVSLSEVTRAGSVNDTRRADDIQIELLASGTFFSPFSHPPSSPILLPTLPTTIQILPPAPFPRISSPLFFHPHPVITPCSTSPPPLGKVGGRDHCELASPTW